MLKIVRGLVVALGVAIAPTAFAQPQLPNPNVIIRPNFATWGAWENLGGSLASEPVCFAPAVNQIECYARGPNNQLHRRVWDGAQWQPWQASPGIAMSGTQSDQSSPSCVRDNTGLTHCFVRGDVSAPDFNGALQHTWFPAGGAGWWENLSGVLSSVPNCTAGADSRVITCFGRGSDGALWGRRFDGNVWGAWQSFGGAVKPTTVPACVAQAGGRVDCVIVDNASNRFVHRIVAGGSSAWAPLSGATLWLSNNSAINPECANAPAGGLVCYAMTASPTNQPTLMRFTLPQGASSWTMSALSELQSPSGRIDFSCLDLNASTFECFVLNTGNGFSIQEFTGGQWRTATNTAPPFAQSADRIDCLSWDGARIDCFVGSGLSGPMAHIVRTPARLPIQRR
ncbi:MAG: hypothetical protein J0L81_13405 [Caulobacterales bacterium]|jgi:hypothetical protein|nr:hypothetical protein [Caulobacterales bacterium]